MKISKVDGSVCGALLNRPSASLRTVGTARRSFCRAAATEASIPQTNNGHGSCPRSSRWILSTFLPPAMEMPRPCQSSQSRVTRRCYSTESEAGSPASRQSFPHSRMPPEEQERHQLMSLVQQRGAGTVQEHFDFHRDPYRMGYAHSDGPSLRVSEKKNDVEYPTREETMKLRQEAHELVRKLCSSVGQRIRYPNHVSLDSIYKLYCQLPQPRMLCLTWIWRNRLMKVMGMPGKRDAESMLRYYALVADVKNAGLALRRAQWNFALAFGNHALRTTTQDMETALRLWREMEKDPHAMANDVTFNVLFDVAAKSGKFALAEMLYKEMDKRGIVFNRFHHVSLIHYFGLRLDSGGIRAAYKEMVDSGEVIDTVVLNCVISGFLRCGEEEAAEETYKAMKSAHALASDIPQRDYMMSKVVTQALMTFSKAGKQYPPNMKKPPQNSVLLTPDLHTYKLLIQHYAIAMGNLAKVAQYLDEMKQLKIPVHPTLFLALFKGFHRHGGFPGSDWSEQRLKGVLTALYQAKDANGEAFSIESWLVLWALRAVKKCSSNEAVLVTFDAMAERWTIESERLLFLQEKLDYILQDRDKIRSW
ncbi:hypothetical protein E4U41_007193 [Claviceps citrina]|nr:hypothetical protein E4U41_007193 [Claviceps citrina]